MRVRKTLWIFSMAILLTALVLVINSRVQLNKEIIIGGADSVFVETDHLKGPLDDYDQGGTTTIEGLEYPEINITDWQYILINSTYPSATYVPELREINSSGLYFARDALANIKNLLTAIREEGYTPYVLCAYRSYNSQLYAFTTKANFISAGGDYSYDEAVELAKEVVAYPGTSDHQTGLAVDIVERQFKDASLEEMDPAFFEWLDEHCAEYGFIKRYPANKKDVTGWDEPWHYRYVGLDAAAFIMDNNLTLEEFISHYRQ